MYLNCIKLAVFNHFCILVIPCPRIYLSCKLGVEVRFNFYAYFPYNHSCGEFLVDRQHNEVWRLVAQFSTRYNILHDKLLLYSCYGGTSLSVSDLERSKNCCLLRPLLDVWLGLLFVDGYNLGIFERSENKYTQ